MSMKKDLETHVVQQHRPFINLDILNAAFSHLKGALHDNFSVDSFINADNLKLTETAKGKALGLEE